MKTRSTLEERTRNYQRRYNLSAVAALSLAQNYAGFCNCCGEEPSTRIDFDRLRHLCAPCYRAVEALREYSAPRIASLQRYLQISE